MKQPFLSVVIPCYDEMANLRKGVLNKVHHFLQKQQYSYEVLIVDDGSTDGGIEFIKEFVKDNKAFRLIQNPHLGKAGAVTTGVLESAGEIVLFSDMDQATPIEEIKLLLPYFEEGYDIVIGSRGSHREGSPLSRVIISRGAILMRSVIIGMGDIKDTQCGFKAFKREAAIPLFKKIKRMHHGFRQITGSAVTAGFDMELLFMARKLGNKIKEVPVSWLYVESRRVNPMRDSVDGILALVTIKLNDLLGKYK